MGLLSGSYGKPSRQRRTPRSVFLQITLTLLNALVALLSSPKVAATSWDLSLDLRAVESNGRDSYLDGGLGTLRYDANDSGLHVGRFRAALDQPIGEVLSAHAEVSSWGDDDKNPIDFTEAFLEYRPYPVAGFRSRVRLGAFFLPMSLENRAKGWETPYTITPSAISSWIGEELRTIGVEGQVDWLGTRTGRAFDLQLTGAVFGWNDPAGVMLALHGFGFSDRQSTLFGRVGEPGSPATYDRELFHEIDGRPGFYVGGQARYLDRAILNLVHYDNRADPSAYSPSIDDFAWQTRFDSAALRVETAGEWTLILQAVDGNTYISPGGRFLLEWEFNSQSAMLAKGFRKHLVAARYDDFEVETAATAGAGNSNGKAWAVAYSYDTGKSWRVALEWLRVESYVQHRPTWLGESPFATERKIELSVRYSIASSSW